MPSLAELQAVMARRLTGDPAAEVDAAIGRAVRALQHKRLRVVAHLLPRTREALGDQWHNQFRQHAAQYTPCGLLYHVDDAWEFGLRQSASDRRAVRHAAKRDLAMLGMRYSRNAKRSAHRIRENRNFYLAVRFVPLVVVLRIPGRRPLLYGVF
jgi:hypothetical protein